MGDSSKLNADLDSDTCADLTCDASQDKLTKEVIEAMPTDVLGIAILCESQEWQAATTL